MAYKIKDESDKSLVALQITDVLLKDIDLISKKEDRSRSNTMVELIRSGLDEYDFDTEGFVTGFSSVRKRISLSKKEMINNGSK